LLKGALSDIAEGIRLRRVWLALASEDIGDQHKRTALGPLWLLINYLAFAGTFIFVFNRDGSGPSYHAHLAVGLLVWFYIMETISQSVSLFVREESFIKGTTLPLSVYVMRLATQSVIRSGYAALGCLAILFLSDVDVSLAWGWSVLGILLILLTSPAAITIFAFLGAYFPDSQFIISNVMRIGMFLTPVLWTYTGEGGVRGAFYYWNPFTYFIEIVRAPILTGGLPARPFLLCAAISLVLWIFAMTLLGRYRKQVVFVL
jgi:lipopolysaccharide transport system permease protein